MGDSIKTVQRVLFAEFALMVFLAAGAWYDVLDLAEGGVDTFYLAVLLMVAAIASLLFAVFWPMLKRRR